MPFGSVRLIPGVNTEKTATLNTAGISESSFIRFKDLLAQKYGGWERYYSSAIGGVPRDLHAWQDLSFVNRLAVGTTTNYTIIANDSLQVITPQTYLSDFAPDFSTTMGSAIVEVVDPNIDTVTSYDSVFFNTPVSVGGLILSGLYQIIQSTGATSYTIEASANATATVANGGAVPIFTTTLDSALVSVLLEDHGLSTSAPDNIIVFSEATTDNGVTIDGAYAVNSVTDADNFVITASTQATATGSFDMNGGDAELLYYISIGPPPNGVGFGLGGYGDGGFGTGVVNPVQQGTPITATDWTSDNWGEIITTVPAGGGVYYWAPNGGFQTLTLVTSAPPFNSGMFISTTQQIMVAYGSSAQERIGVRQDPMLVRWCDSEDFFTWEDASDNQAGSFRIPIGSEIRGGLAGPNANLLWTDLDLWAMTYIGYPEVFGFNKIGAGAGLVGRHAAQQLRGSIYWMGPSNFYAYSGGGVSVIPCPVWDAVFQNLNTDYLENVRAMPNTPFNEVGWLYPSINSVSGECDSYVKFNITEPGSPWDYGSLARSAWIDQTILGPPVSASPQGLVYSQETTNDADGQVLAASFTTGYFVIAEAEDYPFVDMVIPDMKWGLYGQSQTATVAFTFYVVDFPGDTVRTYGPYNVTQSTKFITTRFRGRQMAIKVSSSDLGSFWRLGNVRYRFSAQGRR